jgi:hypothetical protein
VPAHGLQHGGDLIAAVVQILVCVLFTPSGSGQGNFQRSPISAVFAWEDPTTTTRGDLGRS